VQTKNRFGNVQTEIYRLRLFQFPVSLKKIIQFYVIKIKDLIYRCTKCFIEFCFSKQNFNSIIPKGFDIKITKNVQTRKTAL